MEKNLKSQYFHYFSRPLSDYVISKSEKTKEKPKAIKKSIKSLYQDAIDRSSRHDLALKSVTTKQAEEESTQISASLKPCKQSYKLFTEKQIKEIESALQECENPKGLISSSKILDFFRLLNLLLPVSII